MKTSRFLWPAWVLVLALNAPTQSQDFSIFRNPDADDPSPLSYALAGFVESGNSWKPMAEGLLAKGAKVDAFGKNGQTPLIRVITSGATSQKLKVEWLLNHGADASLRSRSGENALAAALATESEDSSDIIGLVLAKSDVRARDDNGNTPLFAAAQRGDARFVTQILDKGAEINAQNALGDTVLHIAAQKPGPLLQLLLSRGARADVKNRRGDLPIHVALRRRDSYLATGATLFRNSDHEKATPTFDESLTPRGALIASLMAKSDVGARDGFGLSPLLLANLAREQESRDLIAARKPKIDATTQFFDAVAQGNLIQLKILLAQKPFLVNWRLPDGTTPLHVSALWGTLSAAQLLIQRGADVNARDSRSETPLHKALTRPTGLFARRAQKMTAFLLEKGANARALDEDDASPLHLAVRSGNRDLVASLLAKNVNVNGRDKWGQTPLFALISETSDLKMVKMLLEHGANPNVRPQSDLGVLALAAFLRRGELVQLLLEHGADAGAIGADGCTPIGALLFENVGDDPAPILQLLLDKGADPNGRFSSRTPLENALWRRSKELVRILLATKKVDLEKRGSQTPIWLAVSLGEEEAAAMLLDAGADWSERDNLGRSIAKVASLQSKAFGDLVKAKTGLTE